MEENRIIRGQDTNCGQFAGKNYMRRRGDAAGCETAKRARDE
jgi:hypothetical protein